MTLENLIYEPDDLLEINIEDAPSLDLPVLEVKGVYIPKDGNDYMLFHCDVKKSYRPEGGCPLCGSPDIKLDGHATKSRYIHDVVRENRRVDLILFPPKMKCRTCGNPFTPEIKGIYGSRQMTERLDMYLRKECFLQPLTELAEKTGFSIPTIGSIMDEELAKYEAERAAHPPVAPRVLGIDEKHMERAARGVLTDIERGKLLDMLPDNKRGTMMNGIMKLVDWDKNIEVVTTDMNAGYTSWLPSLLPNAVIVIDKFHVIQDIEQSINKAKKPIYESVSRKVNENEDKEERARQKQVLRIIRKNGRLLNFSMARLTREGNKEKLEKLATVIDTFPEYKMLHNLRYTIEHMYEQETYEEALKIWKEWLDLLPPGGKKQYKEWCDLYLFDEECFESFRSFKRQGFQRFAPYILNYFISPETRVTNAATEGINSLIGSVNGRGNGYSFRRLRGKCLYASLVYERKIYGINRMTFEQWLKEKNSKKKAKKEKRP